MYETEENLLLYAVLKFFRGLKNIFLLYTMQNKRVALQ